MSAACRALIEQVEALAVLAAGLNIPFTIDAEETERLEMSLDIIEAVAGLPALKGWDGLGMAIQAYGKRARPTVAWANALGEKTGRRIAARLVKGRLLGHRDQAHAGAGAGRLSACSRARRRPTFPTSPAPGTCWRRSISIRPSRPTTR